MAERKAQQHYIPPDFDPKIHGSLNGYYGQHHLRDRARKLDEGILIIRFETPFNMWCETCGEMIPQGRRFNAEKKAIGNYYSTTIWQFRMRHVLCQGWIEIHTDPKNTEYVVISGARRQEKRYEAAEEDHAISIAGKIEREKLDSDAVFRLEAKVDDETRAKAREREMKALHALSSDELRRDDYTASQLMRRKLREEKKQNAAEAKKLSDRGIHIPLLPESLADTVLATEVMMYGGSADGKSNGINAKMPLGTLQRREQIQFSSIFGDKSKHLSSSSSSSASFASSPSAAKSAIVSAHLARQRGIAVSQSALAQKQQSNPIVVLQVESVDAKKEKEKSKKKKKMEKSGVQHQVQEDERDKKKSKRSEEKSDKESIPSVALGLLGGYASSSDEESYHQRIPSPGIDLEAMQQQDDF